MGPQQLLWVNIALNKINILLGGVNPSEKYYSVGKDYSVHYGK
jgi:hypothetical protein